MQQSGRQSVHRKLLGMASNMSDFFLNWRNFMVMLTTMTKQIRNFGISIVVTQVTVTKSNFPTMSTSKKVFRSYCDNERQPEIAIWPPKPKALISLEL